VDKKKSRALHILPLWIILSLFGVFCAHQGGPSGGPVDTTPPQIILTYPASRALHFHDNRFSLELSKYIDRRSLEESIFISPSLGELTFDWGGKDVEVHFSDLLRENTTYIVMIGTDVVDTRNHNRMASAYSLAFSTGDHIDSGEVAGRVFDSKVEGIMIFGYEIDGGNGDTLNPSHTKPDYITQTGKDGTFSLPYLKIGRYRVIAVRDEYKNLLYDRQSDQYGVMISDVSLSAKRPFLSGLQCKMTAEDTIPPFVSSVRALDRIHVLLRFSKQMDTSNAGRQNISIVDTTTGVRLDIFDISFVPHAASVSEQNVPAGEAQLVTSEQDSTRVYRVTLRNFTDVYGNAMSGSLATGIFAGNGSPDTAMPRVTILTISDGSKSVPRNDSIQIGFSEAVRKLQFTRGCTLCDSGSKPVDGKFVWWNSMAVTYVPSAPLASGMSYKVVIVMDSLQDFAGNKYRDSTKVVRFQCIDENALGSIKGVVTGDSSITRGRIVVIVSSLSSPDVKPQRRILEKPGQFLFDELQEGQYVISAFNDIDSNNVYTYGKPYPFHPSERFTLYPDTLKVRARWPLDGVVVRFN